MKCIVEANSMDELRAVLEELVPVRSATLADTVLAAVLQMRIDNPPQLHVKLLNLLRSEGVETLGDLVCLSEVDLLKFPNLGTLSIQQIGAMLLRFGLRLNVQNRRHPPRPPATE